MAVTLAIIAAFRQEVGAYLDARRFKLTDTQDYLRIYRSDLEPEIVVVEGGVGREKSQAAAALAIERYRPNHVVNAGFAGGVLDGVGVGDLFLCDRLYSLEGPAALWRESSAAERSLDGLDASSVLLGDAHGIDYTVCGCMTVPALASGANMKIWIGANFPVQVIDMESFWVSQVAASHRVPHLIVRSVLDPLNQTLPDFVGRAVDHDDSRSWRAALTYVISKPAHTPQLVSLALQTRRARASLGRFLGALKPVS